MKTIYIYTEYITLGQFLKLAGIIRNGGEAKTFLLCEKVYVNNEFESRRGRKLYDGYKVIIRDIEYLVKKDVCSK